MRTASFAVVAITVLALPLQAEEGAVRAWTDRAVLESGEDFHFAVIADNTGGPRAGVLADAVAKLNLLRPAFVMTVGDLIEGYKKDDAAIQAEWSRLLEVVQPLDMRLYFVPGNHETSSPLMAGDFEKRFGRAYYHFVYNSVLFICLNTQDGEYKAGRYPSAIGERQIDYVRQVLTENQDVRWTFVLMHQPLWDKHTYSDTGWEKVQSLLSGRPHTVFAGHYHRYGKHEVDGHAYIRLATTGGDTRLAGAEQGEFDHITWVTMTGEAPIIANLSLEGIHRDDVSIDLSERAYWSVNWLWPVLASSIVTESPTISEARIPIHVSNITDAEMTARVTVTVAGEASPRHRFEFAVEPGGEERTEAIIAFEEPVTVANMGAILVGWDVEYPVPGRETVRGRRVQKVIVEPVHKVQRTEPGMKVDGDLSDWSDLPMRLDEPAEVSNEHRKPWKGPADASCRFGVASDGEFLYVGVEATDDAHYSNPEAPVRCCDGLSILVDPRERAVRGASDSPGDQYLNMDITSPGTDGNQRVVSNGPPLEKAAVASVRTQKGYNIEVALPLSSLADMRGAKVTDFRLNICMHDREDGGEYNHLWWRPYWRGTCNYADSGTFRLE